MFGYILITSLPCKFQIAQDRDIFQSHIFALQQGVDTIKTG